jgi:hypothetical protein
MANGRSSTRSDKEERHEVWTAIDDLRSDMGTVKSSLARLGEKIEALSGSVNTLNDGRRTPWGNIIAAASLVVMLVFSVGSAALGPIYLATSNNTAAIEKSSSRLELAMAQADIRTKERQAEVRSELQQMDSVLQREMRDLDAVGATRIDHLDTNLQREMRMLQDLGAAKRDALSLRVDVLERTLLAHTEDAHPTSSLLELEKLRGDVRAIQANRFTSKDEVGIREELGRLRAELDSIAKCVGCQHPPESTD